MSRIQSTQQFRQFLLDAITATSKGDMKPEAAARITKLAAQVNENMYAELKAKKVLKELGEVAPGFGDLRIGQID